MSIDDCQIIELPKIYDARGSLTFVEGDRHIPFDIRRVYYLYDVPGAAERGGHAHVGLQQLLIAASGSFDVHLDDGVSRKSVSLNRPWKGLLIPQMIWREIKNFSGNSMCLVLASLPYDEADYYRDYLIFLQESKLLRQREQAAI
jgi:hypothetical protein